MTVDCGRKFKKNPTGSNIQTVCCPKPKVIQFTIVTFGTIMLIF